MVCVDLDSVNGREDSAVKSSDAARYFRQEFRGTMFSAPVFFRCAIDCSLRTYAACMGTSTPKGASRAPVEAQMTSYGGASSGSAP
jgi:hypothetical protein